MPKMCGNGVLLVKRDGIGLPKVHSKVEFYGRHLDFRLDFGRFQRFGKYLNSSLQWNGMRVHYT